MQQLCTFSHSKVSRNNKHSLNQDGWLVSACFDCPLSVIPQNSDKLWLLSPKPPVGNPHGSAPVESHYSTLQLTLLPITTSCNALPLTQCRQSHCPTLPPLPPNRERSHQRMPPQSNDRQLLAGGACSRKRRVERKAEEEKLKGSWKKEHSQCIMHGQVQCCRCPLVTRATHVMPPVHS